MIFTESETSPYLTTLVGFVLFRVEKMIKHSI